jgi:hypothetical protein
MGAIDSLPEEIMCDAGAACPAFASVQGCANGINNHLTLSSTI